MEEMHGIKDIKRNEFFVSGHGACPGCGIAIAIKNLDFDFGTVFEKVGPIERDGVLARSEYGVKFDNVEIGGKVGGIYNIHLNVGQPLGYAGGGVTAVTLFAEIGK